MRHRPPIDPYRTAPAAPAPGHQGQGAGISGPTSAPALGTLLGLTVAGRRRADDGEPSLLLAAGWVGAVLGGLAILASMVSLASGAGLVGGLGAVIMLVAGIKVILASRA